jgi:hypothetical protein
MPEISRFYGIVIKMYFADHAPPHFHAEYAEHEARIAIESLALLSGELPPRRWVSSLSGRRCIGQSFARFGARRDDSSRSAASSLCPDSDITVRWSRRRNLTVCAAAHRER